MSKIGIQSGGAVINLLGKLCARSPISMKLYGLALNLSNAQFIHEHSPSTTLVLRNIGRGLDYGWNADYIQAAKVVADAHIEALTPFLPFDPWVESHNEPPTWDDAHTVQWNIDRAKRGNEWQVIVADKLHAAGFKKVLAYSFSVGTPAITHFGDPTDLWPFYQDGITACEGLALHEYWKPVTPPGALQRGLTLRYRDARAAMRDKRPIMITELGLGFDAGYSQYTDMSGYLAQLNEYDAEAMKDDYLLCAHIFLNGSDSGQWATWDVQQDGEYESKFIPWLSHSVVLPIAPVAPVHSLAPQGENMITADEIQSSIAFTFRIANQWDLGEHLFGEVEKKAADGKTYIINLFAGGGVVVEKGHFAPGDAKFFDRKTFAISDGPSPVVAAPVEGPPITGPARLTALPNGLKVVPYHPATGELFWGLVQAGSWKLNAGTELIVITRNSAGTQFGVPVANAFGANRFEQVESDGSGAVKLDFGHGSAFNPPADGPNAIYVSAGDGVDGERWPTAKGDKVLFGFPNGAHLEGTLTFQLMKG